MDSEEAVGGDNKAARPMEFIAMDLPAVPAWM